MSNNNTREFYKKQLEGMTNSQLLEVMHTTPIGLMGTTVGNDKMKIALEILQERWTSLEERVTKLETVKKLKISVAASIPTVTGKLGRGRPKKAAVA